MSEKKLYARRDSYAMGTYYTKHVMAMTSEDLHWKSAIAAELGHRDMMIDELCEALKAVLEISKEDGAPSAPSHTRRGGSSSLAWRLKAIEVYKTAWVALDNARGKE